MMQEGINYHITIDPKAQTQDDWSVILAGPWDRVVGRYKNIEIKDGKCRYEWETQYLPEGVDVECTEFDFYISDVLMDIIKEHHDKGAMIYVSKETGEVVDY